MQRKDGKIGCRTLGVARHGPSPGAAANRVEGRSRVSLKSYRRPGGSIPSLPSGKMASSSIRRRENCAFAPPLRL